MVLMITIRMLSLIFEICVTVHVFTHVNKIGQHTLQCSTVQQSQDEILET